MSVRHPIIWLVAVLCLSQSACEVSPEVLDPLPTAGNCTCTVSGDSFSCPDTHCGLRVVVDSKTCKDKVAKVEVLVGDTVEPHIWTVGDSKMSCRAIPRGSELVVYARADTPWKWQSQPIACNAAAAGTAIEHVLECKTK